MMGGIFCWIVYKHGPCRLLGWRMETKALTTHGKGQWSEKFTTGHKIVQTHGSLKWRQNFLGMGKMEHYVFRQRVPMMGWVKSRVDYISLPHLRVFYYLVQCLTGMTKLPSLGTRYSLSKSSRVLLLSEGFCLLSR